jgi:FAD/FMN-containing dehydrogenase
MSHGQPLDYAFLRAIREEFPDDFASSATEDLEVFGRDWTRVFSPAASLLVRPRTTAEVARFLGLAHHAGVAVVPSGGRTGLAGGAMATDGEVVLSLARMTRMDTVDTLGDTVRVQAGAVTEAVHHHVEPHGLLWPVDFASKGSSQVGGNIATNAGGVKVIRYGLVRQWVLGLEVVLADGTVLEIGGALEKDNTGIDLRQLFIGSEGILGVITEATLKLTRAPVHVDVFLFALKNLEDVVALFQRAKHGPFRLMAYEFFTAACSERLRQHRGITPPFAEPAPYYVLLEVEDGKELLSWIEALFQDGLVSDGVLAQHSGEARALWQLREGISESLSATGFPHKNDISLPIARLHGFTLELVEVFGARYPGWEICLFGHIGDGNLHINVMKPDALSKDDFNATTQLADDVLFELVAKHHGSISAEHGIGLLKKKKLHYTRSSEEIAVMRALKSVLDPKRILNPGKIFDPAP